MSRGEAWELGGGGFQSSPGDSDQLGLEAIAGELGKDTETQAFSVEMIWASIGSVSPPNGFDTHQTLKPTVLRESRGQTSKRAFSGWLVFNASYKFCTVF